MRKLQSEGLLGSIGVATGTLRPLQIAVESNEFDAISVSAAVFAPASGGQDEWLARGGESEKHRHAVGGAVRRSHPRYGFWR
jgi:hypothetical protein